jgi:O-acetyl-ADP-ribose deacetylase (regulator of RNase III)
MKIHETELTILRGSVLDQPVDAIVNAANTAMRGGGVLDGAIHRAAGREMLLELERVAPQGSETSEVVVTGGYNLPQKFVFHVAGPIWNAARGQQCDELLAHSYRNCLHEAQNRGLQSLAFPSLSTGVYSFPIDRAAPIAVGVAVDFLKENPQTSLQRVIFAMFGGTEYHFFDKALKKHVSHS